MSQETTPLQFNMFSGELDDNRTAEQKKRDRQRQHPQQIEMFSQRDIAQFGVNPKPLLPLSPHTRLGLMFEDPRTEDEKARDIQRQAEANTYQMFVDPGQGDLAPTAPEVATLAVIVYEAPCLALMVIERASLAVIPYAHAREYDQPNG